MTASRELRLAFRLGLHDAAHGPVLFQCLARKVAIIELRELVLELSEVRSSRHGCAHILIRL